MEGARVRGLAHDGGVGAAPRAADGDHLLGHIEQSRIGGHKQALHRDLHALRESVECLADGAFDSEKWGAFREIFSTHVVED